MRARTLVAIRRLPNGADLPLPSYATPGSAGMDLMAACDSAIELAPGARDAIPTGIAIALPTGYEAQVRPRSGLALRHGIGMVNAPGTIDSDYRGEIRVLLINHGAEVFVVEHGMRIAQMVIAPMEQAVWHETDSLDVTMRGASGFGSTDKASADHLS